MTDTTATEKKTILVVEDELIIAKGIEKRLKALGYKVAGIVATGEEAVEVAMKTLPDLVLMDICLQGGMDGVSATEKIRAGVDIPVVYLTAYADPDSLGRAKLTEPFGYIVKPFQDITLRSTIEMALYKHSMESRLRRSEQSLATILRSIGDAVIATDSQGLITFMNPVAQNLTGWSQDEALGRELQEVFRVREEGPDAALGDIVTRVVNNGTAVCFLGTTHLISRGGKEMPIEAKATPFVGVQGGNTGLALVFTDITGRMRTEEALRRSEQLLSLKNQVASVFLTVSDDEMYSEVLGIIMESLKGAYGIFGFIDERGDLVIPSLTKGVWEECRVHDKTFVFHRNKWGGLWGRALLEQKTFISNSPLDLPEGHLAIENFLAAPVLYHNETIGFLAVANKESGFDERDKELLESIADRIAPILDARLQRDRQEKERRQAEDALANEKERLAVTLRSIGDGVITTDVDGSIVMLNKAAEEMTGWPQEDAKGKPFDEVFNIVSEKTRQAFRSPVERVLDTGRIVELENNTILIARNGEERLISDSAAPIRDRESRIIGTVLVFRDVTEKRKMEKELQKAQQLESIGILAGGIAHDFNNLLTAVLGNISLAKMYLKEEDRVFRKLNEAENASLRARDLTQQLLTFSRGGAPVKKIASIGDIVRESAAFTLSGSKTTCNFQIEQGLWSIEVDEGQFSQVINNLVMNADQSMPAGGVIDVICRNVYVGAESLLPLRDGPYILVSIKDYGVGIPEESLDRIFEPYFTTKKSGKGLGLATVYSIIRNHSGHIDVKSNLGEGTTFSIYLPCSDSPGAAINPEESQTAETSASVSTGKVLVMDDEENIREVAGEMLAFLGYGVDFANDGEEAAALYRKSLEASQPYSAVLMDLTIPGGMGGKETIGILREMDPDVKGIVSSGYSNDPIMADFKAYGFSGIISKPYKLNELKKVLEQLGAVRGV
ncbi:MAG: PAS domain S-box protein [Geobacteraceae bacterium]|nr:PAS domain S-box protein [Geobacteraceae bacterium]